MPESGCHNVHEYPERSSLVPPQSWFDIRDAMQFNLGHSWGTVLEVPLEAKVNSYGTQVRPISTGSKVERPEDGVS